MKKRFWMLLALAVLLTVLWCASAMADDAGVTEYNLWVGGVRVTSENMDNIPGVTGGVARFDPATNTLTLDHVDVSSIKSGLDVLTITGEARFFGTGAIYAIYCRSTEKQKYMDLVFENANIIIEGIKGNNAIECNSFTMNNSDITIRNCEATGIYTKDMVTNNTRLIVSPKEGEHSVHFINWTINSGYVDLGPGAFLNPHSSTIKISNDYYVSSPAGLFIASTNVYDTYFLIRSNELWVWNVPEHFTVEEGTRPPVHYHIDFDLNGVTCDIKGKDIQKPYAIYVWEGDTAIWHKDPYAYGYRFDGWYLDADTTQPFNREAPVMSNLTLYAKWTLLPQYTVSFDMDGHGTQIEAQSIPQGECAKEPVKPTDDAWLFEGWYAGPDLTYQYRFDTPVISNTTIYANWRKLHSVVFIMNGHGGENRFDRVPDGEKARPCYPNEPGYKFSGWYQDYYLTEPFDFNTPIREGLNLYAKWLPIHTVSFEMQGHGTPLNSQSVIDGDLATRPKVKNDSDYYFEDWYADAACTQRFNFSQSIHSDVTLYAKWLPYHTVSFEMNGHGQQVPSQQVPEGWVADTPQTPTDQYYQFMGWYTDAGLTQLYSFYSGFITQDTVLYAKWKQYPVVYFNAGTGSGSMMGVMVYNNTDFILPDSTFTPPNGAVFAGWQRNGTGDLLLPGTHVTVTASVTFYARYDGPFTVTFDPDGGSGTMADVTVGYGETYTLPECGFTPPAGKKFEHWNVEIGDTTTLLWPRYTLTVTQNMTLKPDWRTARATFQANGGKGILTPVDMVPDSSGYITLPPCSLTPPDGRMFAGWLVGGTVYQPGQRAPLYGDTLIPAQWTTAHYTVTYDKNGGSGAMASFTTQGDTFTLPECGFTPPAGKQFAYWIVSAAVTNYKLYYPGQTVQINANTTVQAVWDIARPSSWTVSFTPDDGTGTMPSITVADEAYLTFPECGFTPPEGKTFEHWVLKTEDGFYMGTYHPGDQVQIYQNYIVWPYYRDLVTHYVNFYDPSNYNILNTQDIVEGGLVSVPEVSVPGYTLHSWYFRYRPDENSDWITIPFDFGQPVEFYLTLEGDPDGTAISVWADLTQNEHHIALTVSDGGTAQLDPAQDTYHYGDVVYINWEMDSGCHYEGITLTPAGGESQTLDYSYFTMPDCDVAVDVRFRRPVIHSGTFGDGLYWSLSEGTLTIGGVGPMPDFTWENEAPWMAWKNEIYGVEIQPGVTAVGKLAFTNISGLGYASLPGTVTRIGSLAFYCCSALSEIQLPDGLTMIEDNAFVRTGLYDVSIPASVRVIEESAFEVCERLESVTLREGIEEIGSFAFGSCPLLREITIPQSVTMLGSYAFDNCTSLQRVSGLEHLEVLYSGLFCECGSLTDIGLLPRVSVIPGDIFARCHSLSSIAIPSTVTRIEDWAFDECDSLTAVYYEGSRAMWDAIQIGDYNDGLEHATIYCKFALTFETYVGPEIAPVLLDWDEIPIRPDDPKHIGSQFQGWYLEDTLDTVYDFSYPLNADTTLYAEWYSPDPHYTLRLPNMLTTVESEAFADVKAYAVAVPRSVTFIADDAFSYRMEYVLGFPGTYAQTWAQTHGMAFIEIDDAWLAGH